MSKRDRRVTWATCIAFFTWFAASSAQAGDDVNAARGMALDGQGLRGQVSVDLGWMTGNTAILQLKPGLSLAYDDCPHSLVFSLSGNYAESNGVQVAKQMGGRMNYRYRLLEHWAVEVFTNHLYDKFAGFDARFAAGQNIVFLTAIDALQVDVGAGLMAQYEEYGVAAGPVVSEQNDVQGRGQIYVFIKYALAENLQFLERAFYIPRLDWPGPEDYMLISATSLAIKINPVLMFQNSINISYDSPPPANTKALNTELMAGLAVRF